MGYGFTDRIKELFGRIWRPIVVLAIVAALIMSIMAITNSVSKAAYAADITRLDGRINTVSTQVQGVLALGTLATKAQLDNLATSVIGVSQEVGDNSFDIGILQNQVSDIQTTLVDFSASPPEGYLTGTFGNYTLHVKCSEDGNYTANVNLVYDTPVGNATTQTGAVDTFYAGINWTAEGPNYVCDTTYSGNTSSWGVTRVWFNIGIFPALAANETAVDITFNLTETWQPGIAYVQVFPVA